MDRIETKLKPSSPEFAENDEHNRALADDLRRRIAEARLGGPEVHRRERARVGREAPLVIVG